MSRQGNVSVRAASAAIFFAAHCVSVLYSVSVPGRGAGGESGGGWSGSVLPLQPLPATRRRTQRRSTFVAAGLGGPAAGAAGRLGEAGPAASTIPAATTHEERGSGLPSFGGGPAGRNLLGLGAYYAARTQRGMRFQLRRHSVRGIRSRGASRTGSPLQCLSMFHLSLCSRDGVRDGVRQLPFMPPSTR